MLHFNLIVGLGNPEDQYEGTRHNVGFAVLDSFAGATGSWKDKFGAKVTEVRLGSEKVILVKPQTYMNRSGEPLQAVLGFYKVDMGSVVVVSDELDLPLGTMRIRRGGGTAGHKGLASISQNCGGSDFTRLRVGVGRPENPEFDVADWVLGKFSSKDSVVVEEVLSKANNALLMLLKDGLLAAQQNFSS